MSKKTSRFHRWRAQAQALLNEGIAQPGGTIRLWQKFVHFWVLVGTSFTRNRCPVRASALAYTTLLALIPMLAVVMSITSTFLKKQGEERIYEFIGTLVASITPPTMVSTNLTSHPLDAGAVTNETGRIPTTSAEHGSPASEQPAHRTFATGNTNAVAIGSGSAGTNEPEGSLLEDKKVIEARKTIARQINEFIQNTRSGALGLTGTVLLIFVGISMLSRIESTFNDIWGVQRGRSWFMQIVFYWGVLSLAPMLLVVVIGLATGSHFRATKEFITTLPLIGYFIAHFGFQLLPVLLLCLGFAAFYMLMPNTRVHWCAALMGGAVGGLLFHLNSLVSVLYVSRVVSNSRIYGGLGLVPVFMIGLYLSWLILLFGAQVAYAFQNRTAYFEERQIEQINQRGREFIALRLMTLLGQRFLRGQPPLGVSDMAQELSVPSRLLQQILQTLASTRLVVETAGGDGGYLPARPLESITCHDVLLALRASHGQELATRNEPVRAEVYGEFQRIQEAERQAAESITMLTLAHRAQHLLPG
jgi:membrane protein